VIATPAATSAVQRGGGGADGRSGIAKPLSVT